MCVQSQPFVYTESRMILVAGYFDESSDNDAEERCFTVGGYIASGAPAAILELRWNVLLGKYNLAYFKASELDNMFGQFKQHRDDPNGHANKRFSDREKQLIRDIKTEFVDLIVKENDALIAVSATVIIRDWNLIRHEDPETIKRLPPFYQLCGHLVMLEAGLLMNSSNAINAADYRGQLRPIFDTHQEYSKRFVLSFPEFARKNPNASKFLLPPLFEKEEDYLMLQAADLFVYEMRRTVGNYHFDGREVVRKAMERLLPQISRTFVLDRRALYALVGSQSDFNPLSSLEAAEAVPTGFIPIGPKEKRLVHRRFK